MDIPEFIESNIKKKLEEKGYDAKLSHRLAKSAAGKYKSLGNQGGKMFDNLLKEAEKQAKRLSKVER